MSDTVGFVRHLPHQLVEAFRSTLEEVADSDLILHVVDGSHPDPEGQIAAVREVLAEIGADQVPELIVINKADVADPMVVARLGSASRTPWWSRRRPARASPRRSPRSRPTCRGPGSRSRAAALRAGATCSAGCTTRRGRLARAHRRRHPLHGRVSEDLAGELAPYLVAVADACPPAPRARLSLIPPGGPVWPPPGGPDYGPMRARLTAVRRRGRPQRARAACRGALWRRTLEPSSADRVLRCPPTRRRPPRPRGARGGRRGARRPGAARPDRRWPRRSPRAMDDRRAPARPGRHRHRQVARLPRARRCCTTDRVVVATATLALQHQLVERDIPALLEAADARARTTTPSYAVLKGRSNYACLHRIREGVPDDQGALVELPDGLDGRRGARAARVGRGGGRGRAAPATATTRPSTPTGCGGRSRSATASASAPPSARSATECFAERAKEKAAQLPADRHQPLAARDRRDRGRPDDPRVRRRGDRRGPRAVRAGDPGRHRRAVRAGGRARRPPRAAARRGHRGRRPRRRRRRAARRDRRVPPGPDRRAARARSPTRSCWSATRPARWSRRSPRSRPTARATPGRTQARGLRCRRCSRTPSGWPPTPTPTCCGSTERERQPRRRPAVRRAAAGVGADARQAARREDRGADQRDADARRRLRRGGHLARAQARRAGRPLAGRGAGRAARRTTTRCRGAASTSGSPFDYGQQAILYVARHLPPPGPRRARRRPSSTRSSTWSTPPTAARSGCSPAGGPPRPRPRRCASGCRT